MTTQQKAGVDVLAVMDAAIERVARPHEAGLHKARAAVAELIEADKEYDAAKAAWENAPGSAEAIGDTDGRDYEGPEYARWRASISRRAAALARIGGAQ